MRKMKASATNTHDGTEQQQYRYDPQAFLLTPNQMLDNDYPMPSYMPGSRNAPLAGAVEGGKKIKEIGQVRAGNSSEGDDVWLPGSQSQSVLAEVVQTGGALVEKGLSLSDEIMGRLGGGSSGKTPPCDNAPASSASSSTSVTKKAKKREREGAADVVVEVTTTAADLERFAVGEGWMETPTLRVNESAAGRKFKVLAIDCEMVRSRRSSLPRRPLIFEPPVLD